MSTWRARSALVSMGSLVGFLVVWELVSLKLPPVVLPHPTEVFAALWSLSTSGQIGQAFLTMLAPLAEGFVLAMILGAAIGFFLGLNRWAAAAVDPLLYVIYSLPHVALLPLIIVWFGIGYNSTVIFVFISAIFSVIVNTESGVRNVDPGMLDVVRSLGANRWEEIREVIIPSTLPFLLSGMRIAVVMAVVGVIIAELFISATGVGYLLQYFSDTLQLAKYFAPLILVAALGVLLKYGVDWLDRKLIPWRQRQVGAE